MSDPDQVLQVLLRRLTFCESMMNAPLPTMPAVATIHVVDDDTLFRNSIARSLRASGYHTAIYESGHDFLTKLPLSEAGCILLDLQMAGMNGFELQERLTKADSILPIVFLTAHGDIGAGVHAIKAGAEDFLPKPVSREALLECVDRALARNVEQRQQQARLGAIRSLAARLTPREAEVFSLVVRGKLNKQIAHELGTS